MHKIKKLVAQRLKSVFHHFNLYGKHILSSGQSCLNSSWVFSKTLINTKTLNVLVSLLALYVSYQSLRVGGQSYKLSQKAIEQADIQFRNNSYAEKLQMKRSQAQFDSAMQILNNYQEISKQALIASKRHC